MRKFSFYFFILVVSSCNSSKAPEWYTNPVVDNGSFYGIGFSNINYEDAKRKALIDITAQIKTNINSTTISSVDKNNDRLVRNFSQTAMATVENLEINNYNIEKQFANDKGFYILLSLNKLSFVKFLESDILFKINSIKNALNHIKNGNIDEKLLKIKDIKEKIKSIYEKDFILRVLDKNHNFDYQKDILEAEKAINDIKHNISFFIDCENEKIKDIFSRVLMQNGYKVEKAFTPEDKNLINLKIDYNAKEFKVFDSFIFKINLNCNLKSANRSFFSFVVEKNSSSLSGQEEAKQNLYRILEQDLKENLVQNILQFNKD